MRSRQPEVDNNRETPSATVTTPRVGATPTGCYQPERYNPRQMEKTMELFDIFCYLTVFAAICCLRYNPQPKPQIEQNYTPETQVDAWEPMETEVDTEVLPPLESPDFPPLPVSDPWDLPTEQAPRRRQWVIKHFSPVLALPPAIEPETETEPELTDLDSHQLRKLCTAAGVNWRNARGKNKHMTKAAMIANLKARVA